MRIQTALLLCLFLSQVLSQTSDSLDYIIEDKHTFNNEVEESGLLQFLEDLTNNPVNINAATVKELSAIPYISEDLAGTIINYRNKNGLFFSVSELYMIKDIPEFRIREILPYVTITTNKEIGKNLFSIPEMELRSRFRMRNINNPDPEEWSHMQRLKLSFAENVTAGFLTEKDENESSFTDFASGYLRIDNSFLMDRIIAGDFLFEAGQGLLFWSPYGLPKGSEVIRSVHKRAKGITDYHSSNEANFFRGIATEKMFGNLCISAFYSDRRLDAVIDSSGSVLTLIKDGVHITSSQLKNKGAAGRKTLGGSLKFENEFIRTEAAMHNTVFDGHYKHKRIHQGYSLSADIKLNKLNLFGETAFQENSFAVISGITIHPFDNFEFVTTYRKYAPDYLNLYGWGFGERSGITKNETGLYSGIKIRSNLGELNCYMDQYSFLSPGEYSTNTLKGNDFVLNLFGYLTKKVTMNIKFKFEKKDDLVIKDNFKTIIQAARQNLRMEVSYRTGKLNLKFRGEFVGINNLNIEKGVMVMQEAGYKFSNTFSAKGRVSVFRTDSFSSAIYQYESGIPGIMENSVLFGEGIKLYLALKINIKYLPIIYVKYSELIKKQSFSMLETKGIILQIEWI